jgi:chitodextrinase
MSKYRAPKNRRRTRSLTISPIPAIVLSLAVSAGAAYAGTESMASPPRLVAASASESDAGSGHAAGDGHEHGTHEHATAEQGTHEHGTHEPLTAMPQDEPKQGLVYDGLKVAKRGTCLGEFVAKTKAGKVCTHGPDDPMPGLDPKDPVAPVVESEPVRLTRKNAKQPGERVLAKESDPAASQPGATPAAGQTVPCDGDGTSGNRVQVLYVHGSNDRFDQFRDSFVTWSAGIDEIYSASAQETGGDRHVRFVTDRVGGECVPAVVSVRISDSALGDFGSSIDELQSAGFNRQDRKYVMWTDANVYCGIGGFADDDRKIDDNQSNFGPSYGRSDNGCWSPGVAAHELGHNLGAVNSSAPNTSRGGHCVDEYDLMCYSDEPYYPRMQIKCPDQSQDDRLDCNHDDYYSTDPAAGSYLASHFNVADNFFLIQGGGGGGGGGGGAGSDTTAPSAPGTPQASQTTASSVVLTWSASQDDTGVVEYDVLRDGAKVGSAVDTTLTVQGLTPATDYSFTVVARDAAGNSSDPSAATAVTTADGGGPGSGLTIGATGTLTNGSSGRVADVAEGNTADDAPVIQYPLHGGANQQWTVLDGGNGAIMLQAKNSNKCLTVRGASQTGGAIVVQKACAKSPEQLWKATASGAGFVLTAEHSGKQLGLGATRYAGHRVLAQRTPANYTSRVWVFAAAP